MLNIYQDVHKKLSTKQKESQKKEFLIKILEAYKKSFNRNIKWYFMINGHVWVVLKIRNF